MITALATMIRPTILRTNLCCSMSIFAEVAMLSWFEGVAAWCMSVLVEQNPGRECEDDHQRRIDERRRTNVRFQVARLDNPMRDESQRQSAHNTDHPGRKIGTENVDGRRVMAEELHCDKRNEKQHQ